MDGRPLPPTPRTGGAADLSSETCKILFLIGEKMKDCYKLAWSILFTGIILVIMIYFSGQAGTESHALSIGIVNKILTFLPVEDLGYWRNLLDRILRKFTHFFLYFLLGLGLMGITSRQRYISPSLLTVILGVLCAVCDEFHQTFSPGRLGTPADVGLDTSGVLVSVLIFFIWKKRKS